MKLLDGREVAAFIKERHARQVRALGFQPRLTIIGVGFTPAIQSYLRVKKAYGHDIGAAVEVVEAQPATLIDVIRRANADTHTHGIIVQLPLASPELAERSE